MANKVLSKVTGLTKFLARNSKFLERSTMIILANALILNHFEFACTSWFEGLTNRLKGRLQTAQNKLIRVILNLGHRSHIGRSQFVELNWLPVESRVTMLRLTMIQKILFGSVPIFLSCLITKVKDTHNINTRGSISDLCPYKFKTVLGKGTFAYMGAVQWNKLDRHIKVISSLNSFKKSIKVWLLERVAE